MRSGESALIVFACHGTASQEILVMFGYSCSRQYTDQQMVRENGDNVSLQPPKEWPSKSLCWSPVCWCCAVPSRGTTALWDQAIAKLKQRFTFGHWEVGQGKLCCQQVTQAADGSLRVGQPAYIKNLDFAPLGKLREQQHGSAPGA